MTLKIGALSTPQNHQIVMMHDSNRGIYYGYEMKHLKCQTKTPKQRKISGCLRPFRSLFISQFS